MTWLNLESRLNKVHLLKTCWDLFCADRLLMTPRGLVSTPGFSGKGFLQFSWKVHARCCWHRLWNILRILQLNWEDVSAAYFCLEGFRDISPRKCVLLTGETPGFEGTVLGSRVKASASDPHLACPVSAWRWPLTAPEPLPPSPTCFSKDSSWVGPVLCKTSTLPNPAS